MKMLRVTQLSYSAVNSLHLGSPSGVSLVKIGRVSEFFTGDRYRQEDGVVSAGFLV